MSICKGYTALIKAAWNGNVEIVKNLIAHGANVNKKQHWGRLHNYVVEIYVFKFDKIKG